MKKILLTILMCLIIAVSFVSMVSATAPFEGQTLNVLYMSSVYADAARDIVSEFEQTTGAKVEVIDFPYSALHEKTLLDLTSKTGSFDVISVACQWDGEFAPYLEPLEDYIKKDNYDTSDFIENVFKNAGIWDGVIRGLPHANTPYVMAYRKDLVEGVPKTYEEYLEIAKKYTDPGKDMYGISGAFSKTQFGSVLFNRLFSMGGSYLDENWNPNFDSEIGRKAVICMKDTLKYADPASISWGLPESINAFLQGNAVFCEAWPTLGILQDGDNPEKSKIVGKWELAPFPYEKTGINNLSAWDLAISKYSKHKELAWEWVKMYTSKAKQVEFFDKFQILSPRESFWKLDKIKSSNLEPLRDALNSSIIYRIPARTAFSNAIKDAVAAYMVGQMNLDQTMAYAEKGMKEALEDYPPPEGVKNQIYLMVQERLNE